MFGLPKLFVTLLASQPATMSQKSASPSQQLNGYFQLMVDSNGQTSIGKKEFKDVESTDSRLKKMLDENFATPTGMVFTQMQGENPWHHCPTPQVVVVTGGAWYIKTTDGEVTEMSVGDILYQDNCAEHPAAEEGTNKAKHFSGPLESAGFCDQIIVSLDQKEGPIPDSANKPSPL